MSVLAKAPPERLRPAWEALGARPAFNWLRPPETGTVMVRGRVGGTGQPFNLGEMTVTRCAVTLSDGTIGHATVPGRDRRHAEIAALADALMQRPADAERVERDLVAPLEAEARDRARKRAAKAAATKVDFFTMVRGEDA